MGLGVLLTVALMVWGSSAQAAVRWDDSGGVSCWGGPPKAWAPTVGSSGWIAWIPAFISIDRTGRRMQTWGNYMLAHRDSRWRFPASGIHNEFSLSQDAPNFYMGQNYVLNYVYDYDTRQWSSRWARGLHRDILGQWQYNGQWFCNMSGIGG